MLECETLCPTIGPTPDNSQRRAMTLNPCLRLKSLERKPRKGLLALAGSGRLAGMGRQIKQSCASAAALAAMALPATAQAPAPQPVPAEGFGVVYGAYFLGLKLM